MPRTAFTSERGATAGPYSHAIDTGALVFLSGQTPRDPDTGALVEGGIGAQTTRSLDNLAAVLAAAGLTSDDVVKCNVYLVDMDDFAEMNQAYAAFFTEPRPARTTIGVAALPMGARVEIEMIAQRPAGDR